MANEARKLYFPTNPKIIKEFLYVLRRIDGQEEKTPKEEWKKYRINQNCSGTGNPMGEDEVNILKKLNQEKIIKLKDGNVSGEVYYTYFRTTERFQGYKEVLDKKLEELDKKQKEREAPIDITPKDVIKQPTLREIQKDAEQGMRIIQEHQHQKELQRREFKQRRILNSKEDKKIHALNTIIEYIEPYYPKQKNISMDYYYFNFEDRMVDSKLFEKFLEETKKEKCFKDFNRTNYTGGTKFSFIEVDLKKIKEFKERIDKRLKEESTPPKKELFKLFPEIYGMGINLKVLPDRFKMLWDNLIKKFTKK